MRPSGNLFKYYEKQRKLQVKEDKKRQKRFEKTGSHIDLSSRLSRNEVAARYLSHWGIAGFDNVISIADHSYKAAKVAGSAAHGVAKAAQQIAEPHVENVSKLVLAAGLATAIYIAASTYVADKLTESNNCAITPGCDKKAIAVAMVEAEKPETFEQIIKEYTIKAERTIESTVENVLENVGVAKQEMSTLDLKVRKNYNNIVNSEGTIVPLFRQFNKIRQYSKFIDQAAKTYNLSSNLLTALIAVESQGDTYACSKSGACGLMQLMPGTATDLGLKVDKLDPSKDERRKNPQKAIDAGAKYLSQLINRFDGDEALALMAYNLGPTALAKMVKTHGDNPSIVMGHLRTETRLYPIKILSRMKILEEAAKSGNPLIESAIQRTEYKQAS